MKKKFAQKISYIGKYAIIKNSVVLSDKITQVYNEPYKIINEHIGTMGKSILLETKVSSFIWCKGEYKSETTDRSFWMNVNDCSIL